MADEKLIIVEIEKFNNKYLGVGRHEGKKVLVPAALPGEKIECKILKEWKSKIIAIPENIIRADEQRVKPDCKHFKLCAGCQFQHMSYESQLELKKERAFKFLERQNPQFCKLFEEIIPSPTPYHYRNTIKLHGPGEPGFWKVGGIEILQNSECPVCIDVVEDKLAELREEHFEKYMQQNINNVMIRGSSCGEVYVGSEQIAEAETEWLNEEITDPFSKEPTRLKVPAHAFWQGSTPMIGRLIEEVAIPVGEHKPDVLIETYCGVGAFSLFSASKAKNVIAIEENPLSVEAARKNKKALGLDNMRVIAGKTENELDKLLERTPEEGTSLIVDPPRSGLQKKVLKQILAHPPEQLIYVSCNPDSLARNLAALCDKSYRLKRIRGLDLFPQTKHLECVAVLERL
jgi:tRNA/tmRNA/rRNA uracil-C5-methylase (TrmA/RlmC/RlmD family)